MKRSHGKAYAVLISAGLTALIGGHVKADWAQTMGIGQKSTNLGGAVTATSDDYDAFYTNPAGAANFDSPFIGFGIKTFDTRGVSIKQTDVSPAWAAQFPDAQGLDLSPGKTLSGESIALVPSGAGYMPLPGMPNVVIGIGQGVPFLVSGDFSNDSKPGNYGKFDSTDAALVVTELSPLVAMKVSDRLNIGASVGFTTFKYMKLASGVGLDLSEFGGSVASLGNVNLETKSDIGLPVPPWEFATSPTDVSFTLGAQYKILPNVTFGITYRSETPETFEGKVTGTLGLSAIGFPVEHEINDRFKYDMELPRHIQAGVAVDVTPKLKLMTDVRWTNWSDTKGFGSDSVIKFKKGDVTPFPGVVPATESITVNYNAEDTFSLHLGAAYKLTPNLELQAGYVYDPGFMPKDSVDLITFSADRHIFSLGGTYTKPTEKGEWAFTLGGQIAVYEDTTIKLGESGTAGGAITNLEDALTDPNLTFKPNNQGGYDFGGYVWSVGTSISYRFGSKYTKLEPEPTNEPLK